MSASAAEQKEPEDKIDSLWSRPASHSDEFYAPDSDDDDDQDIDPDLGTAAGFSIAQMSGSGGNADFFSVYRSEKKSERNAFVAPTKAESQQQQRSHPFATRADTPRKQEGWATTSEPLDRSPKSRAAVHFDAGLEYMQKKDYEEALNEWRKALELDPENRLYKSNLNRVIKILEPDEPTNF